MLQYGSLAARAFRAWTKMDRLQEEAFIELMDATEEYILFSAKQSEAIKQGLFHISQARYAYHVPLGQAQYHAEMEACTRMHVQGHGSPAVDDSVRDDPDGDLQFQLSTTLSSHQLGKPVDATPSSASVERQAQHQASSMNSQPTASTGAAHHAHHPDSGGHGDPLRWWGILVPPALRTAQKDFLQAVHLSAQVATVKSRLVRALARMSAARARASAPTVSSGSQTAPVEVR